MEIRQRKWTTEDAKNTRYRNKAYIDSSTAKLIHYYADGSKKIRKSMHICRCCFYFDTSRIGGSAITTVNCAGCDITLHFANTCTDIFCNDCAEELKMCKHCGAKMD